MKYIKKTISILLSLVMIFSVLSAVDLSVFAAEELTTGSCGTNVTYSFDSSTGTLTISGTGDMDSYFSGFSERNYIKKIVIENGVTSICREAFYRCTAVSSITIADSVTSIGQSAFEYTEYYNNDGNWEINTNSHVLYIGKHLIICTYVEGTYSIKSGTITIADSAFAGWNRLESITIPNSVVNIGNSAFAATSLKTINIPNSIISIGSSAFANTNISSVILPNSVQKVGNYVFEDCKLLETVTIGDQIQSLMYTFQRCESLKSIYIPENVSIIESAFDYCSSLESINVSESNSNYSSIDGVLFNKENTVLLCYPQNKMDTTYIIPNKTTKIEIGAFDGSNNLNYIIFNNNLKTIEDVAFANCESLKQISLPNSLTYLGESCFANCISLTDVSLPTSISRIREGAFSCCTSLSYIELPDNIINIDSYAFCGCDILNNIIIPKGVKNIGRNAFDCNGLSVIYIKSYSFSYGSNAIKSTATIYACTDSTGQKYARNNSMNFVSIGHEYSQNVLSEANCTEDGAVELTCSVCGETHTEAITAHGHNYEITCSVAGDCVTDRVTTYTCMRCGDTYSDVTEATGHKYSITNSANADCTHDGYNTYTCSVCGDSYNEITENASGHSFTSTTTPADCENDGCKTFTCSRCGLVHTQKTADALGHNFETRTVNGQKCEVCTRCGLTNVIAVSNTNVYSNTVTASAGSSISVPVYISGNSGLLGFALEFEYDPAVLTPVSVTNGALISNNLNDNLGGNATEGKFKAIWYGDDIMSGNGILMYLNFTVAQNAVGSTQIKVTCSQEDTFDVNFRDVVLNCSDININITNSSASKYYTGALKIADTANGSLTDSATVNIGDKVYVAITEKSSNTSLSYAVHNISYDRNSLTFKGYADASFNAVNATPVTNDGNIRIITNNGNTYNAKASADVFEEIGVAYLVFEVNSTVANGEYVFDYSITNTKNIDSVTAENCSVTVTGSNSAVADVYFGNDVSGSYNENITVPVYIANNNGIMGYYISFEYNPDELEIVSVAKGDDFNQGCSINDTIGMSAGSFSVLWNSTEPISANGILMYLTFKVKTNSEAISSVMISYSQDDTFDGSYNDVVLNCYEGTIYLNQDAIIGDIDDDGDIDLDDYAYLKNYLSGISGFALNTVKFHIADMNSDGAVDAFDMFLLDKKINGVDINYFDYTVISGNNAKITGYRGTETNITVPSVIDGYNITAIDSYAFRNNTNIQKITISSGIKTIGYGAFLNCTALKEVVLADNATSVGTYAFKGCTSLEKIVIPATVASINANSFTGCTNLKIYGEQGTYAETYANNNSIPFICFSYEVVSGKNVRITGYNGDDAEIMIPAKLNGNTVTAIYNYAFKNNSNIQRVEIASGIKTIGYGAFLKCSSLTEAVIGDGTTSIGTYAFKDCTSLSRIVIPASVTSINANSFTNCPNLTIYGTAGSYAETYANNNSINFVEI